MAMEVSVVYVLRRDAKLVKTVLEMTEWIHPELQLAKPSGETGIAYDETRYVAIPLVRSTEEVALRDMVRATGATPEVIHGLGRQWCPYRTAIRAARQRQQRRETDTRDTATTLASPPSDLSISQKALWNTVQRRNGACHERSMSCDPDQLRIRIIRLPKSVCPPKIETLGDSRVVVIPKHAFRGEDSSHFQQFLELYFDGDQLQAFETLWDELAQLCNSDMVVRREGVHPDSPIRESSYQVIWSRDNHPFQIPNYGPGSSSWITVTEQGIRQSFDLTQVMFSRGNISEKIRFGKLVQKGEHILDMYAGIGYFTLPALIIGGAEHVFACEWNPQAIQALRYNIRDNGVPECRVTVMEGDCRVIARDHNLTNRFDRVSLGLLPSSEGGWRTAIHGLKCTGGWLHVHGNVPVKEAQSWVQYLCQRLRSFVPTPDCPSQDEAVILLTHLEKVKSFAPTVNHYVADVIVGPPDFIHRHTGLILAPGTTAIQSKDGSINQCPDTIIDPPSSALSKDGVLHQDWMLDQN